MEVCSFHFWARLWLICHCSNHVCTRTFVALLFCWSQFDVSFTPPAAPNNNSYQHQFESSLLTVSNFVNFTNESCTHIWNWVSNGVDMYDQYAFRKCNTTDATMLHLPYRFGSIYITYFYSNYLYVWKLRSTMLYFDLQYWHKVSHTE